MEPWLKQVSNTKAPESIQWFSKQQLLKATNKEILQQVLSILKIQL